MERGVKKSGTKSKSIYLGEGNPYSDSFRIMRRFLGKVANLKIRGKLMIAISQNKPFQDILDYNGDVLQDWYEFKQKAIEKYVNSFFDSFDEAK